MLNYAGVRNTGTKLLNNLYHQKSYRKILDLKAEGSKCISSFFVLCVSKIDKDKQQKRLAITVMYGILQHN